MRKTALNECKKNCLFFICLVGGVFAQPGNASMQTTLTLKDATAKTLANNPQLYQYKFVNERKEAQKQTSSLRPVLELEVEVENFAGSGSSSGFDSAETTLALSSIIELGGKRKARMSLVDAETSRALWEQQAATLDVLGQLTSVYIEGLASQENIKLAEESLSLSQSLLRTVKMRALRGATPEAEVMRAEAATIKAEIRLAALVQRFDRQKVLLAHFWGETNPGFSLLDGNLFEFGSSDSFEELYLRVLNSPSIQVFASDARVKDAEVALARTSGRSDLSWRAGIKHFEGTGNSALTAGISVPLFSNARSSGDVKAVLAARNAVDYAKQDALLRLHTKLYEAWSLRNQNIEALKKIQTIAIPALENALQLTREAYENGRYRYFDLVAAQEELIATKQALIDAARNALLSQALIEQLTSEALSQ